jgi:ABC-type uncharacterized transport system involved in gliding motility auxiliary subunit
MKQLTSIIALLLLVAVFFAINIIASNLLRSARIDLTQARLYTLSDSAKRIARSIDEPISIEFYLSTKLAEGRPAIKSYGRRVRELLEEFARTSGGKIRLKILDPEPFSETEDQATAAGIRGLPVNAKGENLYFGLSGTNSTGDTQTIEVFDPSAERFLEYEIAKLIHVLAKPKKKTLGLITSLPLEGGFAMDPRTQQPTRTPGWVVMTELQAMFEVKNLGEQAAEIPKDIDLLMLAHAKGLTDSTLYAIDQFVMRGGHLLAFVDPQCDSDTSGADPRNPMAAMMADKSSNLDKLLNAWGVELAPGVLAADKTNAIQVMAGGQNPEPVSYVIWLGLRDDCMTPDDSITGQLSTMNLASAGVIRPFDPKAAENPPKATTEPAGPKPAATDSKSPKASIEPLLRTGTESMLIDKAKVQFMPDPKKLLNEFFPTGDRLTLAARLGGSVNSAFPDGKPADSIAAGDHIKASRQPINVVLVADADMLSDRFWVQSNRLAGIDLGFTKIADNGDFVLNAADNLSGSSDLIAIRARGVYQRPFTLVEKMKKTAEAKYVAEQSLAQEKVTQAEQRVAEAQKARGDDKSLVLTKEQQETIDQLYKDLAESRRQLRTVKLNLNKDIDALGAWMQFINVGLLPLVVALGAVGLGAYRSHRRRADRRAMSRAE